MTLKKRDFARSREKLKLLCLHYHSGYSHQTWQGGDLPGGAPKHKVVTQRSNHGVLQNHVTNESYYISTTTVSMATTFYRIATYLDRLLLIYSPDPLITWLC